MKRINHYLYAFFMVYALVSCTDGDGNNAIVEDEIRIETISARLGDRETTTPDTRAITDFVVNTPADPTLDNTRLTGSGNWLLEVNLLNKDNQVTPAGTAQCTYNTGESAWVPQTDLYFASYHSPHVTARLAPSGWTTIALDQRLSNDFLLQDILVEEATSYTIAPAHKPVITLRHGHSMLNFMLFDVDMNQISSVTVQAGGNIYQPYPVPGTTNPEFLVILPVGTANPVVNINTAGGARYQETIGIPSMQINNCYCAKLTGVELILSSVTVIDWTYGTALEGQYTTQTTYPTFRGIAGQTVTLYYDNDLQQTFVFNDRGENTVKPSGRTIVRVNDTTLSSPLILDEMYVDLRPYL